MCARTDYRISHQYFRRRLNAGGEIRLPTCGHIGPGQRAAFEVVKASGREPAPVFRHELHYPWNYGPNARVKGDVTCELHPYQQDAVSTIMRVCKEPML